MTKVFLRESREYSVRRGHPWIFSGSIASVEGTPSSGDTVVVYSHSGIELGKGAWSEDSQIRVRMWAHGENVEIDDAFFRRRIHAALSTRRHLRQSGLTNALRIVNSEADGMPGVTVDRYDEWYVCQFTTPGAARWRKEIAAALNEMWPSRGIYERSDCDGCMMEHLESVNGLIVGEEPPEFILIEENGVRYKVDVRRGHKTGFYLDQRENRIAVSSLAAGREVLNTFSYTGGFGVAASAAGARCVTHVDSSGEALELARVNSELNHVASDALSFVEGNAFEVLRRFRDAAKTFDLIILDPPKFADSKNRVMGACRGYKDINLLAMKLLRPDGILATFSCSGNVTPELFRKVVADAAADSGRDFKVTRHFRQSEDHPESLAFPDGSYLKGLLLRG